MEDVAEEFALETARLALRPFTNSDWPRLKEICEVQDVARMLALITVPWPKEKILAWIANTHGDLQRGFRLAVCLKNGPLIGMVGMGGNPVTCSYFLAKEHWGNGYATEANRAFFAACYEKFDDLEDVHADHFTDNPASGRVLRKLGFVETGTGMGNSAARLEPAPNITYRLTRSQFKAATA